jgi:hypothetical protein
MRGYRDLSREAPLPWKHAANWPSAEGRLKQLAEAKWAVLVFIAIV